MIFNNKNILLVVISLISISQSFTEEKNNCCENINDKNSFAYDYKANVECAKEMYIYADLLYMNTTFDNIFSGIATEEIQNKLSSLKWDPGFRIGYGFTSNTLENISFEIKCIFRL